MFHTTLTLHQPNILVENFGHVRIADFGLAKVTVNSNSVRDPSHPGYSERWAAPEVWKMKIYDEKTDIFSFAMVMVKVRHG